MDNSIDDLFAPTPSENEASTETTPTEETQEQVTEPVEVPEEPAKPEPARDENGRFTKQERNHIPVEALLEERAKRQEAERLAAEREQKLREFETQQQRSQRPDPFDSPDEYDAYVQAQVQAQVQQALMQQEQQKALQNFHTSHQRAAEEYGQEAVQEALNWAQQRATTDDMWGRHALAQPDPVKFIVEQRNTHAQFEEFARDPEGFKARLLAEQSAAAAAQLNAPAQTQNNKTAVKAAPKSIASAGTGNVQRPTATTASEDFDAIFNSKR